MSQTKVIWSVVLIGIFFQFINTKEDPLIVTTKNGRVRGVFGKTVGQNKSYVAFKSIPYAKAPIGPLRFKNPVPIGTWTQVLQAVSEKDICIQGETKMVGSEDCLYLNIYTPELLGKKAVMVFIHGGGFLNGSCLYNICSPDYLLDQNIVFVSIQYRLSILGFLSTGDMVAPGNIGLKDQNLALKWIKNNIESFGGDGNKITIFGHSAGSASVGYHLQSPLSKGLFHGAIMQSGSTLCNWAITKKARAAAFRTGKELNITTTDSQTLVNELRKINATDLIIAASKIKIQMNFVENGILDGIVLFVPVLEPAHKAAFFDKSSFEMLKNGKIPNKVPSIIGFTSLEFGLDNIDLFQTALAKYATDQSLLAPENMNIQNATTKKLAGEFIKNYYFGPVDLISVKSLQFSQFASDTSFMRPVRQTVNFISRYTPVYYYRFGYEGILANPNRTNPGVIHGEELFYILGARQGKINSDDKLTILRMVKLWTNFAKTGNPTPRKKDPILDNVIWPVANVIPRNLVFLNISENLNLELNPEERTWRMWKNAYKTFGKPPFDTY